MPESWDPLRRDLRNLEGGSTPGGPSRIGKYPIDRELGRTASSVLYLARDPELGRLVVIKVLRDDRGSPDFLRRFQREGAIAAGLRHPNIITVHDVGVWLEDGKRETPYIVMDYIEGGTLESRACSPREAAEFVGTVAEAMAYAHARNVVHRDLKPANVLIDAAGRPIVTDFGLAKSVRGDSIATMEGSILGTPQYMAPEQVRGDSDKVDARTDVYALGAILYRLLSGAPPHGDPNLAALFDRILQSDPPPPSSRAPSVPRALDAIALKALRRDPAERYASAADLAEDLRTFLAGGDPRARPPSTVRRVLRKSRRYVPALAVGAAIVALLVGWSVRESAARGARVRELLGRAARAEARAEFAEAREGYRVVLELSPEIGEARAGLSRVEWLQAGEKEGAGPDPWSAWKEVGGSATGGGISGTPAQSFQQDLALDPEDRPAVVWREIGDGRDDIYFRRWDGARWIDLAGSGTGGGLSNAPGASRFPALALDRQGRPWIAWDDESAGIFNIYLRGWDGTSWVDLDGSGRAGGVSRSARAAGYPALALDAGGNPVVAWEEFRNGTQNYDIYLRRWNGKEWIELGGSASAGGVSRMEQSCRLPTLALDPSGNPAVAWMVYHGDHWSPACRRWDGRAWRELGALEVGGSNKGAAWIDDRPAVAVDGKGRCVLAWLDDTGGTASVYLKRWDGAAWEGLGGSASEGGVSRGLGRSAGLSLALDREGDPVAAWWSGATGNGEVYLRRWHGGSWMELGGSGSGRGISRTPAHSTTPTVRLESAGNPVVTWAEMIGGANEIYLRRFEEAVPVSLHQVRSDRAGEVEKGEAVRGNALWFQARVFSAAAPSRARLEVEVRPAGTAFTGSPTAVGAWMTSGARTGVPASGLPPGAYRWRARTADELGMVSSWVTFGSGEADFRILEAR